MRCRAAEANGACSVGRRVEPLARHGSKAHDQAGPSVGVPGKAVDYACPMFRRDFTNAQPG